MVMLLLLVLALLPLLGIAWIVISGGFYPQPTVDALFMSLILLTMSGILGTTALFEFRKRLSGSKSGPKSRTATASSPGGLVRSGKVKDVVFFEAHVGEPNKSLVTLSDGSPESQILVLSGDMRNALPVGQKVQITLRKEGGQNVLVNVQYA